MPGQSAPRAPSSLQRRLVAAFTEQVPLKALALFLALGLWFMENVKEPQIELVPVRLIPTLDSSLVLRDPLPQIQAIVAGSPRELIRLNANLPTIHRQISSDAPDTLVIDLRPSDVVLPEGVDAVVREIEPRSVTLRFESTWTRKVPVRSAIDVSTTNGPPPGALSLRIDPLMVEVTGPRHLVGRVAYVRTSRTTIPFPDSLPHLVELDTAGLGAGVRLRPSQVKVLITLASHR
jgi:hypothetical protein